MCLETQLVQIGLKADNFFNCCYQSFMESFLAARGDIGMGLYNPFLVRFL